MSGPIPLSEEQIEKILENANPKYVEKFWLMLDVYNNDLIINIGEDDEENFVNISEVPEIRRDFIDTLREELKIISDFDNDRHFYRKLNLVTFPNKAKDDYDYCELLECSNSATSFKIRDAIGNEYD